MASEVACLAVSAHRPNEALLRPHYSNSNEGRNEIPTFSSSGLCPSRARKDIDEERQRATVNELKCRVSKNSIDRTTIELRAEMLWLTY